LSGARNTGIRHSEGEYVVFLDADDRLLPEALEAGLECFHAHPECAFVFGHYWYIGADGSFLRQPTPLSGEDGHYIGLLRGPYIAVPAMGMYRRFVFATVGLFDSSLNATADYDLYLRIARRLPVRRHGTVVAEYRQHGANMTGDAGKLLRSVIKTLRSQREYARRDELYWEAYKAGLRNWQSWYGAGAIDEVKTRLGEGEWRRAASGAWTLLRYYPRGLALLLRRGRSKNRELQGRTRRPQNFEKRLHRLKGMLEKERQEVRRLREQNQRLASRAQDMERRLREIEDSRSWKLLKRVGRLRENARK
jgi:glycosyltransferase involved in cell wall biosynthesis